MMRWSSNTIKDVRRNIDESHPSTKPRKNYDSNHIYYNNIYFGVGETLAQCDI